MSSRSSGGLGGRWQSSLAGLRQDVNVSHWQNALPAPHLRIRLSLACHRWVCNLPGLQTSSCQCVVLEQQIHLSDKITINLLTFGDIQNVCTFEEGDFHWSLCGEVELGLCCSIHVSLFLGEGAHLAGTNIWQTFDLRFWDIRRRTWLATASWGMIST